MARFFALELFALRKRPQNLRLRRPKAWDDGCDEEHQTVPTVWVRTAHQAHLAHQSTALVIEKFHLLPLVDELIERPHVWLRHIDGRRSDVPGFKVPGVPEHLVLPGLKGQTECLGFRFLRRLGLEYWWESIWIVSIKRVEGVPLVEALL